MTDVAVVTGASSGLGFEIAALLKQRGLDVVGVARHGPDIKGDASRRRGILKLLVNCAGIGVFHPAGT